MTRVAINGFGRIGRSVYRVISQRPDAGMGEFPGEVKLEDGYLVAGGHRARLLTIMNPTDLPWDEMGVDVVIEATGVFRTKDAVSQHIEAGAKRVILTVPAKDELDATVVLGVNDEDLGEDAKIVSNASCTTNCLAPIVKILDDEFGIERGLMTTVHAYTNDQRLADVPHKDFRRSRAATENIIPTTTGAAKAVGKVLPALDGKLDGIAMRVPVPDGSTVDLVVELKMDVTVEQVNAAVERAANGPMAGIVQYTEDALVSTDIIGNPHSSIFDAPSTIVLGGNKVKVLAWYDNEWGYSNRVVDLIERMGAMSAA